MLFLKVNEYLFWSLVGILIIFLGIIVFLIFYIKKYVKKIGEDKSGLYKILNEKIKPDSIVFLGDSLTEFYRLDDFFSGEKIYNRGIAANTTTDVINRLEDNVINIKPRKIFIQIGTNDLGEKVKPSQVIINIKKIISMIQDKLPTTQILLISLYPINKKKMLHSRFITGKRKNEDIDFINEELIKYSQENHITYIDVASHLKDEEGNLKKEYTLEGLHINSYGYLKISEILKNYV